MKTVFNSSEVAHLWANASQSEARTSNENFYFQDNLIYSYGNHFVCANRVNSGLFLVTTETYSNSTAKHLSHVRNAIDYSSAKVFHVCNVYAEIGLKTKLAHKQNLDEMFAGIRSNEDKFHRARIHKDSHLSSIKKLQAQILDYCKVFKCKSLLSKNQLAIVNSEFSELAQYFEKQNKAEKIKRAKEQKAREKANKARIEREKLEDAENLQKWLNFEISHAYFSVDTKVYLRIKDSKVQTSMGANVPVDRAKQLWPLILHSYKNQYHWIENGENFKIGHYRINQILPNGDVKAGCHYITFDVLLDMAKQLELQLP